MRSYTLDEIPRGDVEKIRPYLEQRGERSPIEGLYWVELPEGLLSEIQRAHSGCQPYGVAVEVGDGFVRFELLVRSRVSHRCPCASYTDPSQREFVMAFADRMIQELGIRT